MMGPSCRRLARGTVAATTAAVSCELCTGPQVTFQDFSYCMGSGPPSLSPGIPFGHQMLHQSSRSQLKGPLDRATPGRRRSSYFAAFLLSHGVWPFLLETER